MRKRISFLRSGKALPATFSLSTTPWSCKGPRVASNTARPHQPLLSVRPFHAAGQRTVTSYRSKLHAMGDTPRGRWERELRYRENDDDQHESGIGDAQRIRPAPNGRGHRCREGRDASFVAGGSFVPGNPRTPTKVYPSRSAPEGRFTALGW